VLCGFDKKRRKYEKTQRDVIPLEMVQSSSELEGHPAEEEGLPEGVNGMEG